MPETHVKFKFSIGQKVKRIETNGLSIGTVAHMMYDQQQRKMISVLMLNDDGEKTVWLKEDILTEVI